jgi:hypothetical protein
MRTDLHISRGHEYSLVTDYPYLRRSLSPVLPNRGVPSAVENGQNDDTMSFRAKVHAKRESLGNDTANIPVNRCVGHRPLSGGGHASFDFGYEFDAQVLPFTFVPCCRFDELCARRMTKRYR